MLTSIIAAWTALLLNVGFVKPHSPDIKGVVGHSYYLPRAPVVNNVGQEVIAVIIDSPGGYVDAMFDIAAQWRVLQREGFIIECHVKGMAASAAFFLLTQCDRRIGYPDTVLMWHQISISFPPFRRIAVSEMAQIYTSMLNSWNLALSGIYRGCDPTLLDVIRPSGLPKGFCPNKQMFQFMWETEMFFDPNFANYLSPGFFHTIYTEDTLP